MYYRIKNNDLYDYADYNYTNDCLFTDIITPQELNEHRNKVIVVNGKLQLNPDYENEETQQRQLNFENNFLATPLGNYRLQPKGYANAQQSIDTVCNNVVFAQGLTEKIAEQLIFYATPDFSNPEECTEEWLVQHQSHPEPMTLQEWAEFYITFSTLYAQKMYKQNIERE